MWISEMAARSSRESGSAVQTGTVTIGGDMASAMLSGEARGLGILAPGGIRWLPEAGQDALIVCSEEGERFIAGIPFDTGEGLQAGEVYIISKGGAIRLKNNGDIEIDGKVWINGGLYLNGSELGGGLTGA